MPPVNTALSLAAVAEGWQVREGNAPLRTPRGHAVIVPTRALATALVTEAAEDGLALRMLADHALDHSARTRAATIARLIAYAETDTLCYRALPEEPLHPRQIATWEPLLGLIEARHGVRFTRVAGVMPRPQPPETLAKLRAHLDDTDSFTLTALDRLAGLTASLVIALAALAPDADADSLWAASCLEEEWQAELWGREPAAEARRARARADFLTAAHFAALARQADESPP